MSSITCSLYTARKGWFSETFDATGWCEVYNGKTNGKRGGVQGIGRRDTFLPDGHPMLDFNLHDSHHGTPHTTTREGWYPNPNAGKWATIAVHEAFKTFIINRDQAAAQQHVQRKATQADTVTMRLKQLPAGSVLSRLYAAVADKFAVGIQEDLRMLDKGLSVAGLAAKWAPTPNGSHDKATGISTVVALLCEERGLLRSNSSKGVLVRFQQLLSVLRRAAQLPESFAGRGEWGLVEYGRMPSVCRRLFGSSVFRKHDEERYDAFLQVT